MSRDIAIVFSELINIDQLWSFFQSLESFTASIDADHIRLSQADKHLWIWYQPEYFGDSEMDNTTVYPTMVAALGQPPGTRLLVSMSSRGYQGSLLAVEVIFHLLESWNCIVYDGCQHIYTPDDIRYIYRTGQWFDAS